MSVSSDQDPFDVLSLPARFDLDRNQIERAYLRRAAAAHPDAAGSELSAAQINDAKRILSDLEKRAEALLARLDGPTSKENRDLPTGFLIEIMETREKLEAVASSGDAARLDRFRDLAEARRSAHIERVRSFFEQISSPPSSASLDEIRVELNAWRYAERMIEQIQPDTEVR